MANQKRTEARAASQQKTRPWVWGVIAVIAVLAAVVVISVLTTGDDTKVSEGTVSTDGGSSSAAETQPVTVIGDPLPQFTGPPDAAVGTKAPVLQGFSFDGTPITIDAAADNKPVMVVFLAHWCPHCNREMPRLIQWKQSGAVPADLQVIGVATAADPNRDNYPPSSWFRNMGWPWPVLVDDVTQDAAVAYGLSGYPFFAIVGADGLVKVRVSGEVEIADIQKIVADALAG